MAADQSSVSRRSLIGVAGKTTVAAGLLSPFRALGGVAWAAETPKTYKKWVYDKPMVDGKLTEAQFKMLEQPLPNIEQGKCLIEVKVLNVHSATRSRLGASTKLGDTDKSNYACARVLQSRDKTFKEGDIIACQAGWQTHQVISSEDESIGYGPANEMTIALNGTKSHWNYVFRPQMVKMWSPEILMDVFGTSGTTAYFGMRESGPIMPTDQVAVAGTTGSVGAVAAQLVKARGAYCVGFGGGADRAKWCVDTLGVDKALDYRAKDLEAQLRSAFPKGIDVYCDGVGGELSETVVKLMNKNARYFSYGTAASLYDTAPAQSARTRDMVSESVERQIKEKSIKLDAWLVHVFYYQRLECEDNLSHMLLNNKIKPIYTFVEGIENAPKGIISQYTTNPYGKLQLKFA